MPKFTLNPAPTFWAPAPIPVPGHEPVPVEFEFLHRTREELKALLDELEGLTDVQVILKVARGWKDVDQEFGDEAVSILCNNFHGAARAVFDTYVTELVQARRKN